MILYISGSGGSGGGASVIVKTDKAGYYVTLNLCYVCVFGHTAKLFEEVFDRGSM